MLRTINLGGYAAEVLLLGDLPDLQAELSSYSSDALAGDVALGRLTIGRASSEQLDPRVPADAAESQWTWSVARWAPAQERVAATADTHHQYMARLFTTLVHPSTGRVEGFQLVVPGSSATLKTYLVPFLLGALASRGMLVLHAAGIRLDGMGLLVTGPSGAGKSTAAALLGGHVLSDDIVLVGGLPDRPWVDATPLGRVSHGPARCPLVGVFFPCKAPALAIEPVAPRAAMLRFLLEHGPYLGRVMPPFRPAMFELLSDMFAVTPTFELSFHHSEIDRDLVRTALRDPGDLPSVSACRRDDTTATDRLAAGIR